MKRTLVLLALFVFASSLSSSARIINIPEQIPTIQAGIDSALTGDTVLVAPGFYQSNLYFRGRDIVLASHYILNHADSLISQTILDGFLGGNVITLDNNESRASQIEGFTIQRGDGYDYGGGIYCVGTSPTIRNNIIQKNTACTGGGIGCVSGSSPLIVSNRIESNGTHSCNGGGICCIDTSNAIIANNLFVGNFAYI
jgi:hypothetical protein